MSEQKFKVGMDLGGTKMETIVLDPANKELYRYREPTPGLKETEYEHFMKAVHRLLLDSFSQVPDGEHYTVGIGFPGSIVPANQKVIKSSITCLKGKSFKRDIEALLDRPVAMDNDANCFALAESLEGAAANYRFVFGVILGTGCGGGVCIDGKIHNGRNGVAGEWGHFVVDPDGLECFCGNRGCLETKIAGSGLKKTFFHRYGEHLTPEQILEGRFQGDPRCEDLFEQFLDDFGRSIGGLISMIDPDVIVLGGGLSNMDELYSTGVERVRKYAFRNAFDTPILKNKLGDSAGVLGAAWLGI